MPAQSLNHYTIRVRDLEATKDFYCNIVGLTVGDRPPLNFPGYWLYCGGVPTVHLIGHRAEDPAIHDEPGKPAETGRLDHIAFACEGLKEMKANLDAILAAISAKGLPILLIGVKAPANYGPDYQQNFDAVFPALSRSRNGSGGFARAKRCDARFLDSTNPRSRRSS